MAAGIKLTSINGALTVNLTYPQGGAAPAWLDATFTTPATFPATVGDGATSVFYIKSAGSYVLSVKTVDGTEIAADANTPRTIDLEHPGQTAAYSYDARLLSLVVGDSGHTVGLGGTAGVTSFNTRAGTVTLAKTDVTGTGLAAADVGAAATVHTHAESDVSSLVTDLAGKAAAVHTHAESDTTNLVSDLAAKATSAALTAHTSNTSNPHVTTAAQVSAPNYVNHGATAGTARPSGATVVLWAGSVNPTNATTSDLLVDTTNLVLKRFNGTTWDTLSSVTSFNTRTGAITLTKADVTGTGLAAADVGADAAGAAAAVKGLPLALTGATVATRYVGGTSTGAPASGTFAVGDFVVTADGHVFICTAAGTPGTWRDGSALTSFNTRTGAVTLTKADVTGTGLAAADVGAVALSTVTTKGDLIVATASSAVTRVAVGTDGQMPVADSTQTAGVAWVRGPSLLAEQVLVATATSITFSSIPATKRNLRVVWQARTDLAAVTLNDLRLQINGDTAANYYWEQIRGSGTTASAAEGIADSSIRIGYMTAASAPAGGAASGEFIIPNYTGTTFRKNAVGWTQTADGTTSTNVEVWEHGGYWASTAAITSIKLFPASASNLIVGCVFSLYGE